jgi:putative lipoprotein
MQKPAMRNASHGLAMILFAVSLCAFAAMAVGGQEASQPPPVPASPPVTANPAQKTPAPTEPSMKPAMRWKEFDYTCEGGVKLTTYLRNHTVKIRFQDKVYLMNQVPSADGERYSDGKVVWWGRGNGGFLQEDTPDGDGGMIAKDCKLDKPLNGWAPAAAAATLSSISGTVTYLVRIALPADAEIVVELVESTGTPATETVVGKDTVTLGDRQVPVPYELKFDPAKIDAHRTYTVRARILVDGAVRFASAQQYKVLTPGAPSPVDIVVKPMAAPVAEHR